MKESSITPLPLFTLLLDSRKNVRTLLLQFPQQQTTFLNSVVVR